MELATSTFEQLLAVVEVENATRFSATGARTGKGCYSFKRQSENENSAMPSQLSPGWSTTGVPVTTGSRGACMSVYVVGRTLDTYRDRRIVLHLRPPCQPSLSPWLPPDSTAVHA